MSQVRTSDLDHRVLIVGTVLLGILGVAYFTSTAEEMTSRARDAWWWETKTFGYRQRCGADQFWSSRLRITALDLAAARRHLPASHPGCAFSPPIGERRPVATRIAPPPSR